jgi:uncharacterized membrane protein (UPF0127 family)
MQKKLSRTRTSVLLIGSLIVVVAFFMIFYKKSTRSDTLWNNDSITNATVVGDSKSISVVIARTPESQARGLSGTESLPENSGMLFIFPKPDTYGFWMKDMHYPLDLIWIDQNHTISEITANVAPDTYPEVFYPHGLVTAVLEVEGGFSTRYGLTIGQPLILKK